MSMFKTKLLILTALFFSVFLLSPTPALAACAEFSVPMRQCSQQTPPRVSCTSTQTQQEYCCDQVNECNQNPQNNQNPAPAPTTDECIGPGGELTTGCFLMSIDPLNPGISKNPNPIAQVVTWITFQTPGGILNKLIPFLFVFAGLILFVMILWGGFEMLMGAADTKSQESGKQRITAAITGFALLFISYWIAQIVQFIFGVNVLG